MTIEDETGVANIIVWPKVFERLRPIVIGARFVCVTGKYQNESGVIHIVADKIEDLTPMLGALSQHSAAVDTLARADEVKRPQNERPKQKAPDLFTAADPDLRRVLPQGRNFQ
jgi:error-prone DNA polymerase